MSVNSYLIYKPVDRYFRYFIHEDEIFNLYFAGLLHDFGLIFFPGALLREPEAHTNDEKVQMRKHPGVGEKIFSNLSTFKDLLPMIRHHHEAMDKLWVHSLACAQGFKRIAEKLKLNDSENYFLLGLVHDIGKSILLKAFTDISEFKDLNIDVIQANIQEGHLSVGSALLRRWGFEDIFIKGVTLHEGPEFSPETGKKILVIHLANLLARTIGFSLHPLF